MPYKILPLTRPDIPALVALAARAFEADTHTRMKMHEKGVTDVGSELEPRAAVEAQFDDPRCRMVKAVDEGGRMVGFTNWRRRFEGGVEGETQTPLSAPVANPAFPILPTQTPLEQLEATTSGHLFGMADRANARYARTLICLAISVDPVYQSTGVASALLDWVVRFADEHEAQCWVHLSDQPGGVRAFEKKGFEVVNSLTVDLDRYASREREGGWGEYTFRFLVREPRRAEAGN